MKYFGREAYERARFDLAQAKYETASLKTTTRFARIFRVHPVCNIIFIVI